MKEDMMCVGIIAVDEETMKLELVPLIQKKKKHNILDLAMSGNTNAVMKAVQGEQQHRHIIFRDREWCMQHRILPFCSMTLEIDTGEQHKERTGTR